jgi:hypothetical protein
VDDRRSNGEQRDRLDEIEKGYKARADANQHAIHVWGTRTTRLLIVLTLLLLGLGGWSVILSSRQSDTLVRVQHSRTEATAVTCAVLGAVTDAGRQVIKGSAHMPETAFTRFLEAHGYPPRAVREAQAQAAGEHYAQAISERVSAAIGPKRAARIVETNGTIDCTAFARLVSIGRLK